MAHTSSELYVGLVHHLNMYVPAVRPDVKNCDSPLQHMNYRPKRCMHPQPSIIDALLKVPDGAAHNNAFNHAMMRRQQHSSQRDSMYYLKFTSIAHCGDLLQYLPMLHAGSEYKLHDTDMGCDKCST